MRRIPLLALLAVSLGTRALAQPPAGGRTLAERLGYARDAKLLILHADDVAMAHSINVATTKALDSGAISSASIMMACPWVPEIAAYARSHPNHDLGLHLTLTSEWTAYRWGPLSSKDKVPSLLDKDGYLYQTSADAVAHIDPKHAEAEIRAQVERARAFGIEPTHLDSHMGLLFRTRGLLEAYLRVARDYKLPALLSRDISVLGDTAILREFATLVKPTDILIDHIVSIEPSVPPEKWGDWYADAVRQLQPGVTEFIVHLGHDDEELRGAMAGFEPWGAAWRGRDFDYLTSDAFRRLLQEQGVKLITWREIGKLLKQGAP